MRFARPTRSSHSRARARGVGAHPRARAAASRFRARSAPAATGTTGTRSPAARWRSAARASSSSPESAWPSSQTSPDVGRSSPASRPSSVVLPGAGRADDRDRRAGLDVERDGVEDGQRRVAALDDLGERLRRGGSEWASVAGGRETAAQLAGARRAGQAMRRWTVRVHLCPGPATILRVCARHLRRAALTIAVDSTSPPMQRRHDPPPRAARVRPCRTRRYGDWRGTGTGAGPARRRRLDLRRLRPCRRQGLGRRCSQHGSRELTIATASSTQHQRRHDGRRPRATARAARAAPSGDRRHRARRQRRPARRQPRHDARQSRRDGDDGAGRRREGAARRHAAAAELRAGVRARSSTALFADVAKARKTALVPFLFEGFGDDARCSSPTASIRRATAQPRLLDNVWPALGRCSKSGR